VISLRRLSSVLIYWINPRSTAFSGVQGPGRVVLGLAVDRRRALIWEPGEPSNIAAVGWSMASTADWFALNGRREGFASGGKRSRWSFNRRAAPLADAVDVFDGGHEVGLPGMVEAAL